MLTWDNKDGGLTTTPDHPRMHDPSMGYLPALSWYTLVCSAICHCAFCGQLMRVEDKLKCCANRGNERCCKQAQHRSPLLALDVNQCHPPPPKDLPCMVCPCLWLKRPRAAHSSWKPPAGHDQSQSYTWSQALATSVALEAVFACHWEGGREEQEGGEGRRKREREGRRLYLAAASRETNHQCGRASQCPQQLPGALYPAACPSSQLFQMFSSSPKWWVPAFPWEGQMLLTGPPAHLVLWVSKGWLSADSMWSRGPDRALSCKHLGAARSSPLKKVTSPNWGLYNSLQSVGGGRGTFKNLP